MADEADSNVISLVSELCKSFLSVSEHKTDVSLSASKTLSKMMLDCVFEFTKNVEDEKSTLENVFSLVKLKIMSHRLPLNDNDDDFNLASQINNCLITLEEFDKKCSSDLNSDVLLCLYTLSKINSNKSRSVKDSSCDEMGLYLNSPDFNDINWNIFSKEPAYCSNYSFNDVLGAGLLFFEPESPKCDSLHDFARACDGRYKFWNFDIGRPIESPTLDEGFVTPGSEFAAELTEASNDSDSDTYCTSADDSITVNSDCLKPRRLTWQQLGNCVPTKEPKFASECPDSVIHLWKVWNAVRQTMIVSLPIGVECDFEQLKADINHLLFGVPSNCFYFNPISKTFHLREGLHLKSVTPEGLASFCEPFIECGYCFHALKIFVEKRSKLSFGPVNEAFCECMKKLLQMHRFCLLNISWHKIQQLSQLEQVVMPLRRKLSFLANLCLISMGEESTGMTFPSRVQLLDYLYGNLTRIETPEFKFLLFHFFEGCCNVYLKIVSEWIFNGCFSNPNNYEEFFIYIQRELEVCWDWKRVGYIRVKEKEIPKFLEKYYKDIFACGRSVNLLKIFSKKEVFEKILPRSHPVIQCCFNATQLNDYANSWNQFQTNFYQKYNWSIKLKDKLVKGYSAEHYQLINDTRKKWFDEYENKCKKRISSISVTAEPSTLDVNLETPNLESETALTAEENVEKKVHDQSEVVSTEWPLEQLQLGTSSVLPNEEHAEKTKNETTNLESEFKIEENLVCDKNVEINRGTGCTANGSGDAPSFSGITPLDDLLEPINPKLRTRLTVTVQKPVHDGSGDTELSSKHNSYSLARNECQQNMRKSVSSEYQNHLNEPEDMEMNIEKVTSTPLSICAQNRLKNMSSTLDESLEAVNLHKSTQISQSMRNKIKVMTSEYHQRLCNSENLPDCMEIAPDYTRELKQNEKNKLKVMSSEYHLRLNTLADQQELIENKLSTKTSQSKFDMNTCSQPLKATYPDVAHLSNDELADRALENESEGTSTAVEPELEPEPVSEDAETEGLVTIIENFIEDAEADKSEFGSIATEKNAQKLDNPLDLDKHLTHGTMFENAISTSVDVLMARADTVKDVDTTCVLYYLASSITIPLKIQSKLANEAILWVFIEQEKYLDHLIVLRNYLLLRKPEFSLQLTNSVFEMTENVKKPSLLLNSYTLDCILQRALLACTSRGALKFERNLKLAVEDSIPEVFVLTDIQMLRCLSMDYTVRWPVNVLITEPIIKKYSRMFKFLVQLQRASWVLKRDFIELKNLKHGKSVQFIQIQLYRHNMVQVIRVIQEYVTREALERCWNDLVNHLMNTEIDLDELYISHLKYINKIMQRCFLCEESIPCYKAILNLLMSVLKYHEALSSGRWHRNVECNLLFHTNYKNIHAIYQEFQKYLDDLRATLKILIFGKQKIYFEPLYLELCSFSRNETEL